LRKEVTEKGDELKRKSDEILELTRRVTIQEAELGAVREERDNMRETVDTKGMGTEEIVKRAWELRDQAVARKNTVEIELAKTRIEVMHINGQLMEAIQQKVELSQQLEQWQVDMQSLLDEQLKKKLTNQEKEDKRRPSDAPSPGASSSPSTSSSPSIASSIVSRSKLLRLWR
jgi:coiled-coil domain-containing protein 64